MNAIQYHLIKDSEMDLYDNCYETGNHIDQKCINCPHKEDCKNYEEEKDD